MTKKVQEYIRFDCLLTETQLYSLILLEWNIFLRKYQKKIRDKSITHNIFRIQDHDSIMCRFYCVAFIDYTLAGKIC